MRAANTYRTGAARFAHLQNIRDTQATKANQEQRKRPPNLMKNSLAYKQRVEYEAEQIKLRTKRITYCFICLIGAIFSLMPFLSIHLNQRIGLLVFESDILLLRSSLINVIICLFILILFILFIILLNSRTKDIKNSLYLQKIIRLSIGLFAIISILAYLSLALIVPQVRQIQRMPLATFDCNANEIVIENCHQQFLTNGDDQTTLEALEQLFLTDIGDKNERLIRQLNCFKYNNRKLKSLKAPTRFLLDRCGLVCRPQRQQLHQFSDDLNREQSSDSIRSSTRLVAPYNQLVGTRNDTPSGDEMSVVEDDSVSIKVCFLGDISGGSNYKRFCIENLTNRGELKSTASYQSLTVGQLNAMLRNFTPEQPDNPAPAENESKQQDLQVIEADGSDINETVVEDPRRDTVRLLAEATRDQSTHYVNPIVQFESHFKNWPRLSRTKTTEDELNIPEDIEGRYCKFKPIPPFIVNNKPFSDIQCSLEHQYTMNSRSRSEGTSATGQIHADNERILLRKSTNNDGRYAFSEHNVLRERCNIQCKVNILYQVHLSGEADDDVDISKNSYYLPLKPCLIVSGDGDKTRTFNYYMVFRSIGDSSLLLCFVMIDLLLLIETVDTRQFQLEGKKFRLVGLVITITFAPLIVSIIFDLATIWVPNLVFKSREGYLTTYLNDNILPGFNNLYNQIKQSIFDKQDTEQPQSNMMTNSTLETQTSSQIKVGQEFHVDNYLIPFFVYAIFMFALAVNTFKLPLVPSTAPLVRTTSTEELGMTRQSELTNNDIEESSKVDVDVKNGKNQHRLISSSIDQRASKIQVVFFAMLTLFMGLQFNMSQFIQNQVYIESFQGNQISSSQQQQHQSAFLFILATQTIGSLIILTVVLVFSDEMSSFLADFSPFKAINRKDYRETQQEDLNFKKLISISALSYSLRYLVLVNITSSSRLKWPLVIFYQASELLNFPLTWFTLTSRAHLLISEFFAESSHMGRLKTSESSQSVAFSGHLIAQSILAFIYFALSRLLALFVHSLHASLHLHSDNVDWFIASFYGDNKNNESISSKFTNSSSTSFLKSSQALFTPLPDERQNYLHASRLFIKYNSLICFIFGSIYLVTYTYAKYRIWTEDKKKRKAVERLTAPVQSDQQSDLIEERLSTDLMQIHSDKITERKRQRQSSLHPPRPKGQANPDTDRVGQRARIHFHYDLGKEDSSDLSSSSLPKIASEITHNSKEDLRQKQPEESSQQGPSYVGHNVRSRFLDQLGIHAQEDEQLEEQVTTTKMRNKRVRIVEDGEVWPSMDKPTGMVDLSAPPSNIDIATSPPPPHSFADRHETENFQHEEEPPFVEPQNHYSNRPKVARDNTSEPYLQSNERNRRITFAPSTTLMGGNRSINASRSSLGHNDNDNYSNHFTSDSRQMEIISRHKTTKTTTTTTSVQRASPEPSIDGDEDDSTSRNQMGEADSIEMINSQPIARGKQYNHTN